MDGTESRPVLFSLEGPLRAVGSVVLPSPDALDEKGWEVAEAAIEKALAPLSVGVRRQIRLFLRLLNLLPVLTTGRTLCKLPVARRAAFLSRVQRSRLTPFRRGLWGIRTLIFMGYYNQDRVRGEIGYAADPRGWAVVRDAQAGEDLESAP